MVNISVLLDQKALEKAQGLNTEHMQNTMKYIRVIYKIYTSFCDTKKDIYVFNNTSAVAVNNPYKAFIQQQIQSVEQ